VGNVEHRHLRILEVIAAAAIFGRGVGADVNVLTADGNLLSIGLVDGAVDFLEVVGVGEDLVTSDDVLCGVELTLDMRRDSRPPFFILQPMALHNWERRGNSGECGRRTTDGVDERYAP
jgi:hypothetical protein